LNAAENNATLQNALRQCRNAAATEDAPLLPLARDAVISLTPNTAPS